MNKYAVRAATVVSVAVLASLPTSAGAAVIDGQNWADSVDAYTDAIQNYDGALMDEATTWWVTGPSDADVDGNGYAWDNGDNDFVAGWRSSAKDQSITVEFDLALADIDGNDLTICVYGGPSASGAVLAGSDGETFVEIGEIGSGQAGELRNESFDFTGLIAGDVHYVQVLRLTKGPQTGMFFDSFASPVPEPASTAVLICGACAAVLRRRGRMGARDKQ